MASPLYKGKDEGIALIGLDDRSKIRLVDRRQEGFISAQARTILSMAA